MKKYLNLYVILTNVLGFLVSLPIALLLIPATVNFTPAQLKTIMLMAGIIGPLLAVEYDIVQRMRFKRYMKKAFIKEPEMREYLFMLNSPMASAFHMFLHFSVGASVIAVFIFFTGSSMINALLGAFDGLLIAVFAGLVNFYLSQIIFMNKIKQYVFTTKQMLDVRPYKRKISINFKVIFTINFMFLFLVYINFMVTSNYLLYAFLVLINVALSVILVISISKPINSVTDVLETAFRGEIKNVKLIPIVTSDEVSLFTEKLNLLFEKILNLMTVMMSLSEEVSSITSHLASTGEQITASSEEVAATIQNISLDMGSQNRMIKEAKDDAVKIKSLSESVTSKVNMAHTASKKANDASSHGLGGVDNTMKNFDTIVINVDRALERIKMLQSRSEQINEILDIITKISEQTDLLALNAAIEAARVGEYGKGFAVVTEEIRELAEQSAQSTDRISKLIDQIKGDIEETAEIVTNQHQNVGEGKSLMDQTKEQFQQISKAITLTVNMIKEIAYASEEQMSSIQKYIENITEVAELSGRTSANTEEIAAAMEEQSASMEEVLSNVHEIDNRALHLKNADREFTDES